MKLNTTNIIENIRTCKSFSGIIRSMAKNTDLQNYITELTQFLDTTDNTKRLYYIKYDFSTLQLCEICKVNEKNWSKNSYKNTCKNNKCIQVFVRSNIDPVKEKLRVDKIRDSKNMLTQEQKDFITAKAKNTNILKYGKESYAQTDKFKERMIDTYGYVSPFELKETHDKSKQTLISKTGYDHNFKVPEVKENRRQTFIKNYGHNTPSENSVVKQKIVDTNNERYGKNCPLQNDVIRQKSKETLYKNFEVDSPLQNKDLLTKFRTTMLDTYGYENWLQDDANKQSMFMKSFKYKEYMVNDKTVYLQGYEDYVLFEILLKRYSIDDIFINTSNITAQVGQIFYIDAAGNRHKYYPDFYIKSENKVVEVKSKYTYNKDLKINLLKEEACKKMGLDFEFIIVNKKTYKNWKQ